MPSDALSLEQVAAGRERPILFSAPMVLAILACKKTVTRRLVKAPEISLDPLSIDYAVKACVSETDDGFGASFLTDRGCSRLVPCPYGKPGDRLWCKEGLRGDGQPGDRRVGIVRYAADGEMVLPCATCGLVDCTCERGLSCRMDQIWQWKRPTLPGMFCPRWASRLTLDVESVRVERLNDISEEDAKAEGCVGFDPEPRDEGGTIYAWRGRSSAPDPRAHFATLWDSLNGDKPGAAWKDSPWVWVVAFKRVQP